MARTASDGMFVRHRLGDALPAMFVDDEFIQRFCDGLDAVLAPVPSALDNFWALLDPRLAPPDFLDWLGTWVGVEPDRTWTVDRHRELVANAAVLYRSRGTAVGLADLVEMFTGVRPELVEGGGVAVSRTPEGPLPGAENAELVVRLAMAEPDDVVLSRLNGLVEANKPGHVPHRIEFIAPPARSRRASPPPPPPPSPGPPPPPLASAPMPTAVDNETRPDPPAGQAPA